MAKKILNTDVDILGLLNLPSLNNEAPLHVLTLNNDDDVVIRTLSEILSDIGVTGNYQLLSEKGQANGYAPLDSTGEIPSQYLPDIDTTETDPIFTASPARSITDININNWNEAFFWGDHALAGYVPETRTLSNGPGIHPIGNLSMSRTISLDFDYLDGRYASGLLQREAVLVASQDNITLSGLQTIDGVALSEGDRVLLLGQTNPTENGIYLASTGTWSRATDFDQSSFEEISQGASIFVTSGVDLGGTGWTLQTENPITVGTTPLIFIQYAGTSNYVAGNLIDIVGNSINHEAGTWSNKSNLSGATVISNLEVDAFGHLANWTTRTLTPASIGAEPSFAKNSAFNSNFGTTSSTVARGNHTHTFASITSKPTTLSGYGITNAYTKGESDSRFVNNTGSETITGFLRFTDNTALQFGSDNDSQLSYGSTNDDFRLDGGKIFKIRTAGYGTAFEFNPSSGSFYASGTGSFGSSTSRPLSLESSAGARGIQLNQGGMLGSIDWNPDRYLIRNPNDDVLFSINWADGVTNLSGALKIQGNTAYHSGNHRSDSQNDNRYAIMNDSSQNLGQLTIRTDNSNNRGLRLLNNSTGQSSFLYMDNSNDLNINNSNESSRTVYINKGGNGALFVGGGVNAGYGVLQNNADEILNLPSVAGGVMFNMQNSNGSDFATGYGAAFGIRGSNIERTFFLYKPNGGSQDFYISDYGNGSSWRHSLLYHSSNHRSDSQNDARYYTKSQSDSNYVPQNRTITAGSGLTGGGNLSSNRTISINPNYTGFTNYFPKNANMTNAVLDYNGPTLPSGAALLSVKSVGGSERFRVEHDGKVSTTNNDIYVQTASDGTGGIALVKENRIINTGSGLSGGGNLTSNRTLSVDSTVARTNVAETFSSTVTATNFILSSDRRLKENIESLGNGYYTFNFKDDKTKRKRYGAMADEVKEYAPELIYENEEGYEQVGYIDFLIKKIAELENKINNL